MEHNWKICATNCSFEEKKTTLTIHVTVVDIKMHNLHFLLLTFSKFALNLDVNPVMYTPLSHLVVLML